MITATKEFCAFREMGTRGIRGQEWRRLGSSTASNAYPFAMFISKKKNNFLLRNCVFRMVGNTFLLSILDIGAFSIEGLRG